MDLRRGVDIADGLVCTLTELTTTSCAFALGTAGASGTARFLMKSTPKWFLIPPAIAALLILGTLSMDGSGQPANAQERSQNPQPERTERAATSTVQPVEGDARKRPSALPKTPDTWQLISALTGVLLLGIGGVLVLKRLRHGPTAKPAQALVGLRQTLRLSAKQALHVVEFDDRLLLVGDSDKGLVLVESGKLPERAADEAAILARALAAATTANEEEDEGAVPKDLVLPRPPQPPLRKPATPAKTAPAGLGDFRSLLQKAGRA
jgi:flagellar biogenesis protein FliO